MTQNFLRFECFTKHLICTYHLFTPPPRCRANSRGFDILEISLSNFLPWSIICWSKRPVGGEIGEDLHKQFKPKVDYLYNFRRIQFTNIACRKNIKNKGHNFIRISRFEYVIKKNLKNIKNSSTYLEIYWHTLPKFTNHLCKKVSPFLEYSRKGQKIYLQQTKNT